MQRLQAMLAHLPTLTAEGIDKASDALCLLKRSPHLFYCSIEQSQQIHRGSLSSAKLTGQVLESGINVPLLYGATEGKAPGRHPGCHPRARSFRLPWQASRPGPSAGAASAPPSCCQLAARPLPRRWPPMQTRPRALPPATTRGRS